MSFKQIKIFFFVLAACLPAKVISQVHEAQKEQHIEVSLRMIGHQVLLNAGDSTSLVLPIIKENDRYQISFESEFEFNPDELVKTINEIVRDTKITNGYIVEVAKCGTAKVVYSYEMGHMTKTDIIPCAQRNQPRSCYHIFFTLIQHNESAANLNILSSDSPNSSYFNTNQFRYSALASLMIISITFFTFIRKKRLQSRNQAHLIPLGDYRFDKRKTELLLDQQRVELTSKEADLLILLYEAVNTTIEREVILNRVWGDQGDYVGRTLDVFISKLRKKLEADPKLKIVNIRGVGYKLVMDV